MSPLIIDRPPTTRRASRRRFTIEAAKLKDVRRLVDIEFRAFENERANHILSYRDYKLPAHVERTVALYTAVINSVGEQRQQQDRRAAKEEGHNTWPPTPPASPEHPSSASDSASSTRFAFRKVVDPGTHEAISFAKVEWKTYGADELALPLDTGHEAEPRMNRDWFALNERLRREYVGTTPHCYIGMLATEPKHQHHGAGTLLLEEILAEADDAGVEVYLEATQTARPLYERHGFVAVRELAFAPAEYGIWGYGVERQTVMVRTPK